jgi:hypothetical protein
MRADTRSMIALIALAGALAVFGMGAKYGAEDRPGFDERKPLA